MAIEGRSWNPTSLTYPKCLMSLKFRILLTHPLCQIHQKHPILRSYPLCLFQLVWVLALAAVAVHKQGLLHFLAEYWDHLTALAFLPRHR